MPLFFSEPFFYAPDPSHNCFGFFRHILYVSFFFVIFLQYNPLSFRLFILCLPSYTFQIFLSYLLAQRGYLSLVSHSPHTKGSRTSFFLVRVFPCTCLKLPAPYPFTIMLQSVPYCRFWILHLQFFSTSTSISIFHSCSFFKLSKAPFMSAKNAYILPSSHSTDSEHLSRPPLLCCS